MLHFIKTQIELCKIILQAISSWSQLLPTLYVLQVSLQIWFLDNKTKHVFSLKLIITVG